MFTSVRRRKANTSLPHDSFHKTATKNTYFKDKHSHGRFSSRRFIAAVLLATSWTLIIVLYSHCFHHRPWFSYLRRLSRANNKYVHNADMEDTRMIILSDEIDLFPPERSSQLASLVPIPHILDPDYNDLWFKGSFGRAPMTERQISTHDASYYHDERRNFLYDIDRKHWSQSYDGYVDREFTEEDCRPPSWAYAMKPNCNAFHELALEYAPEQAIQPYYVQYLAHGYYRESYRFRNKYWRGKNCPEEEQLVLKHLRFHEDFSFSIKNQRAVLREAVVMEQLSIRSSFANFYGYCATSTMVQAADDYVHQVIPRRLKWQDEEGRATPKQLQKHPDPLNELTVPQKLQYALDMAEGLAELHGFEKGVISHDDIALDQWVMIDTGRVVLSDVNNAIVMEWNEAKGDYCPYDIDYPYGDLRPAEAYRTNGTATETVDLWGYGTLVFSLLTGMYPFYENVDETKNRRLILDGQVPTMDPKYQNRSLIEGRLYVLVQKCLRPQPEDRMDIFSIVQYLRETQHMEASVAQSM